MARAVCLAVAAAASACAGANGMDAGADDAATDATVFPERIDMGAPEIPFPPERPAPVDVAGMDAAFEARLSITAPANNATVTLASDGTLAVQFTTNIAQAPEGSCGGVPHCGHVWLNVDDAACNLSTRPYNTSGAVSPILAAIARCPMRLGMHRIALSLREDDNSPILARGAPVTATVTVNVVGGMDAGMMDVPTDRPAATDVPADRPTATDVPADRPVVIDAGCGAATTLSRDVQPIFTMNCIGCHGGATPRAGMSLESGMAYGSLVRHVSSCTDGRFRVNPGSPDTSFIIHKLTGTMLCTGGRMPLGGPYLSVAQIDTVRRWICLGARND
jgi:hypothetical protein